MGQAPADVVTPAAGPVTIITITRRNRRPPRFEISPSSSLSPPCRSILYGTW